MPRIRTKAILGGAIALAAAAAEAARRRMRAGQDGGADPSAPVPPAATGAEPVRATPPPETPGPSVTPPHEPMSTTERAEEADATLPEHLPGEPVSADQYADDQAQAAAAEAAKIGGPMPYEPEAGDDPAMRPVYEAGGGEQEGFEAAEAELIEHASHGEGHGDPVRDAFTPELESDRSNADYGEPDEVGPHEQRDPEA